MNYLWKYFKEYCRMETSDCSLDRPMKDFINYQIHLASGKPKRRIFTNSLLQQKGTLGTGMDFCESIANIDLDRDCYWECLYGYVQKMLAYIRLLNSLVKCVKEIWSHEESPN